MSASPLVVKVGGSLYDLPDLRSRLGHWLDSLGRREVLLVPGGGSAADVVRHLDQVHDLGEEAAHWLALQALGLNAYFLATVLAPSTKPVVVSDLSACPSLWQGGRLPILDAHSFARADEGRASCLPHRWSVTSDSVAARVAVVAGADHLVLLKSITLPDEMDWTEAGRRGFVDAYFAEALRTAESGVRNAECGADDSALRTPHSALRSIAVRAVNLRTWSPHRSADLPGGAPWRDR
jgi:aspartokinase-like uncharacterized kinase